MIIGIGNDIVSVDRIREILAKNKDSFLQKILTDKEISVFVHVGAEKVAGYIANRFAAKEAFSKALGTGIGKDVSFKDVEILKTSRGKPYFEFSLKIKDLFRSDYGNNVKVHLSMSDEREYAQAFVVIES